MRSPSRYQRGLVSPSEDLDNKPRGSASTLDHSVESSVPLQCCPEVSILDHMGISTEFPRWA